MKCLFCYKELKEGELHFHAACARKFFGSKEAPLLPYHRAQIAELAKQVVRSQTTLTGVQAKLSLDVEDHLQDGNRRFTIVGLWGRYILKPQTDQYAFLPELEDLVMHLAEAARMEVVPHSLIYFEDGELAYISRRIDRTDKGGKIAMEDFCQLTEHLTEHKYRGSYEQIAKAIRTYSAAPNLDLINFYEQVVFSWIVGNADMHLKNFSLIHQPEGFRLSPAYDLLCTAIVIPSDSEELALTLNGKKRKLCAQDFVIAMQQAGLNETTIRNILQKFKKVQTKWDEIISLSFLPLNMQEQLRNLIQERLSKLL